MFGFLFVFRRNLGLWRCQSCSWCMVWWSPTVERQWMHLVWYIWYIWCIWSGAFAWHWCTPGVTFCDFLVRIFRSLCGHHKVGSLGFVCSWHVGWLPISKNKLKKVREHKMDSLDCFDNSWNCGNGLTTGRKEALQILCWGFFSAKEVLPAPVAKNSFAEKVAKTRRQICQCWPLKNFTLRSKKLCFFLIKYS